MGEWNLIGGVMLTAGSILTATGIISKVSAPQAARELGAGIGSSAIQMLTPANPFAIPPGIALGLGLAGIVGGTAALLINE